MLKKLPAAYLTALAVGLGSQFALAPAQAEGFSPMTMMNPGKWFGGKDRDGPDGDYPPPPPPGYGAPYGAPGYGAPPPGYGYGYGAPPAGAPAYGRAPGAYGAPTAPGYAAPAAPSYGAPAAPAYEAASTDEPSRQDMQDRIQELEQQLQEMEARNPAAVPAPQPTTPPPTTYEYYSGDQTPSSYPFRPMDLGR